MLARPVVGRIKDVIGVSVGVTVLPPGGIERSQGKAKRIIDERNA